MEPDVRWTSSGHAPRTADRRDHATAPTHPLQHLHVNRPGRASLESLADMTLLAVPSLFMAGASGICSVSGVLCQGTAGLPQPQTPAADKLDMVEPGNTFGLPGPSPRSRQQRSPRAPVAARSLTASGFLWRGAGILPHMQYMPVRSTHAVPRKVVDATLRLAGASLQNNGARGTGAWRPDVLVAPLTYASHSCYSSADDTEDDSNTTKTPSAADGTGPLDIDHESVSASGDARAMPATAVAAASVDRLLTVNQYLLRRIRKLELTNQIVREAYGEVQEMLDAERQSNATQLQALKNKHEEDLVTIVKEFDARTHRNRRGSMQSLASSDDDGYGFRTDFSTTRTSPVGASASCTSSPLLGASAGTASPPPPIQRSASETAFTPASRRTSASVSCDLSIEFLDPSLGRPRSAASDSSTDSGTDTESDSASEEEDEEDDIGSNVVFEYPDDDAIEFVADDAAPAAASDASDYDSDSGDSGNESDSEFDSDDGSDSEAAPADVDTRPTVNTTTGRRFSPEDYASVDLVRAVLDRYYPHSKGLDLTADIGEVIDDGADNNTTQRAMDAGWGSVTPSASAPTEGGKVCPGGPQGVASRCRTPKDMDDMESDFNARLPADQRIAKFIMRASSHLQQGARSRLSLGFMLHNLELLVDKFASSHASILCAFVESLYQLAESADSARPGAEGPLRPALSRRQRDEVCMLQQAALRVVKLLHTFIAEPEDQRLVLDLLDGLAEANSNVRPQKHAQLLRTLYECEVLDRHALVHWHLQQPVLRTTRGELLRETAAPLIAELVREDEDRAAESAEALDDAQRLLLAASGATSHCSSVGSLTPCPPTPTAAAAGALTPLLEEAATKPGAAGFGQGIVGKAVGGRGAVTTSTSYVSVMCRSGHAAAPSADRRDLARKASSESMASVTLAAVAIPNGRLTQHASPTSYGMRPAKQVSFAVA